MTVIPTRDRMPQIARVPGALAPRMFPGAAAPVGAGMTSSDILRILRRRKLLIMLCTVIVTVAVGAGTLVWRLFMPFYTASAYLEVGAPKASELQVGPPSQPREVMDTIKMSHARLVTVEEPLMKAINEDAKERIKNTGWYKRNERDPVQGLINELKVSPITGTNFIQLSMTGTEKGELPEIVNAVAQAYVEYSQKTLQQAYTSDSKRLSDEKRNLEAALERVRTRAARERPADAPNIQSNYNVQDIKIHDLTRQMVELQNKQTEAKADLEMIKAQENAGSLINSPEVQQALQNDGTLRSLEYARSSMLARRELLLNKFGPEHPQVNEFEISLASLEGQIRVKTDDILRAQARGLREAREAVLRTYTEQLTGPGGVMEKYDEALVQLKDVETHVVELQALAKEEEVLRDSMKRIDDRLLDMGLLSSGGQRVVFVAAWASTPKEPSMPKWGIMMPLGVFFGLILGLGIAFLLELVDTSVKSPTDVSRRIDLPLLGMVPHAEDLTEEIEELRLAFRTHPNSLISEAFRQIHTCLLFSGPASQRRSILIASAAPQDGRTTVAVNLAAAAARAGRRVLVVDTNFRQPMIRQLFPLCGEHGLSSALVGHVSWRELLCRVEEGFDVLPAGQLPPNPGELLGSDQMRNIIAEMAGQYDQIIFDTAPCTVVTDALGLSNMVDGTILVVRAGANTYGIVQRTRDMLNRIGAHILGVVLDGVRATPGGYLRKNYETFYQYEQAQLPAPNAHPEEATLPGAAASAK